MNKRVSGERKAPEWKKLDAEELGISNSMISKPTGVVLNGLKRKGYEVYLVGGCVRDPILKRIPKDFDVITSAELKQVRKAFHRCEIVGKRFPICHVHVDDVIMEVSSCSTSQLKSDGNSMVIIAARLQFGFTRDLALSLKELSHSVFRLDKGRILLELNYMLAYGFAEASLRLMWRFVLLEIILPIQASYFVSQGFRRQDERSNMLLSLFSNLDRLVAPDRPCHTILWVGIFAFHMALVDQPQDLVFIPMTLFLRVSKIFECVRRGTETRFVRRQGRRIDHESLAMGSLEEVRHVFARMFSPMLTLQIKAMRKILPQNMIILYSNKLVKAINNNSLKSILRMETLSWRRTWRLIFIKRASGYPCTVT
ncbi:hypothetical protein OIU77_026781 [Salix suchowensis]|uniref:Poly(A) polymerase n=1 Tax=Salix suchowensis TaxID=1278906 RepID=A0ABQ9BM92_9ROSI|nr:hypothetical protein OIU77_026781 [Salix suchowensis]